MDRPGRIMTEAAQAYSFSRRAFVLGTAGKAIGNSRMVMAI
jgi:penicillin-binding protein 2